MKIISENIVDRIDRILELQHLNRPVLTENIGITNTALSHWKSRKSNPKIETVYSIAKFLNVSMEYLITGENEKENILTAKFSKLKESDKEVVMKLIDTLLPE